MWCKILKTTVKLPAIYDITKIHEVLCQNVNSGYDIETSGSSVLCKLTMKSLKILRLYEHWDNVTVKEDIRGELWFEIPFSNNKRTYMYNHLKKYEVFADSIEDFLLKYGKDDRYKNLWEKHPGLKSVQLCKRKEDLDRIGYTIISQFEGIYGDRPIVYYGRKE